MSQYPGSPEQPPPAPSAGPYQPPAQNSVGLAAMIVGIASCFLLFAPISSIVAVSLGVVGLRKVRTGTATNRGQALAGVICGAISLVIGVLVFIWVFVVRSHASGPTPY